MKVCTLYFVVSVFVIGCSASTDNRSTADSKREFEDRWILTDYTLDDGTMKSVPDSIQGEGVLGISIAPSEIMGVQSGLCDYYQVSYLLDNDVLTTFDAVTPAISCAGFYSDADNTERSELLGRTFFNSETLIVVSGNLLTVTTTLNEQLKFRRSSM